MLRKLLEDYRTVLSNYECNDKCHRYKECQAKGSCVLLAELDSVEHDMIVVKAGLRVIETLVCD